MFYVQITSAAAHNFADCEGGLVVPDDLDALLNQPGMDRRCLTGNDDVALEQAIVGIYSDIKKTDLAAAREFCSAKGWSND